MSNERIDLTQFDGIMNIDWLFDEQLIVGEGEYRFTLNEYTDLIDMPEEHIKEWEEKLEPIWGSLVNGVSELPNLIAELKRCYEKIDWLQQVADLAADNIGRKNWDGFEEAMYEAGLWERPSE